MSGFRTLSSSSRSGPSLKVSEKLICHQHALVTRGLLSLLIIKGQKPMGQPPTSTSKTRLSNNGDLRPVYGWQRQQSFRRKTIARSDPAAANLQPHGLAILHEGRGFLFSVKGPNLESLALWQSQRVREFLGPVFSLTSSRPLSS